MASPGGLPLRILDILASLAFVIGARLALEVWPSEPWIALSLAGIGGILIAEAVR